MVTKGAMEVEVKTYQGSSWRRDDHAEELGKASSVFHLETWFSAETKTTSAEMEPTGAVTGQVRALGACIAWIDRLFFFQTSIGVTDNLQYFFYFIVSD